MPCVQAPKNQPPANAKGGPFDTEQECKESVGTTGGCPCCSDNDCAKCYCLLILSMDQTEFQNGDCPDGYVQGFDDTGSLFPSCVKVISDFDCNAPLTCVPPQKYIDRGDSGILRSYHCCCQQSCTAPTSSMVADNSSPGPDICGASKITVPQWQAEGFSSLEECQATPLVNECNTPITICP